MNDAQAEKVLRYLSEVVETCEQDTDDILGVFVSLEISDVEYIFEWNGERFAPLSLKRRVVTNG